MKLVAFGCSHTHGWGLSEEKKPKWEDKETGRAKPGSASPYAFPSILAGKLGLECDNKAVPGGSCKEILLNILETDFKPTDTVLVAWTMATRHCLVKNEVPRITRIGPWSAKQEDTGNFVNKWFSPGKDKKEQTIATAYYKHCWDKIDAKIDMHKNIQFAYLWLKDKVKEQYHFSVHAPETKQHWSTEAWFNVPVLGTDIIAEQLKVNAIPDDIHPNKKGHAIIAIVLYDLIQERKK
tara:strand:+ start:430 stop:1140 length:711 start_codon:yes stop_codon:yes gene_type:complete